MTTGQDFVMKAVDKLIGAGVKGKALLRLSSKDGKATLAFSTTLGHLSTPMKTIPATSPDASAPGLPASERSASWTPSSGILTPGRTSSSTYISLLAWPPVTGPPAHEPCALQQRQYGLTQKEREWLKANLN